MLKKVIPSCFVNSGRVDVPINLAHASPNFPRYGPLHRLNPRFSLSALFVPKSTTYLHRAAGTRPLNRRKLTNAVGCTTDTPGSFQRGKRRSTTSKLPIDPNITRSARLRVFLVGKYVSLLRVLSKYWQLAKCGDFRHDTQNLRPAAPIAPTSPQPLIPFLFSFLRSPLLSCIPAHNPGRSRERKAPRKLVFHTQLTWLQRLHQRHLD